MKGRILKWLGFAAACVGAVVLGVVSAQGGSETAVSAEKAPRISVSTEFELCCKYKYCGHEIKLDKQPYIGLSREEFRIKEKGMLIREFSADKVIAEKHIEQYCPEHDIVQLRNGKLCVVSAEADGTLLVRRELGISEKEIEKRYLESLKKGMVATLGRSVEDIIKTVRKK